MTAQFGSIGADGALVFAGLILTSVSTLTLRAALFQRKARSGWLEELDGIREDALVTPEGTVGEVVDSEDIWTDLREGGEYADPHEISSLYATDETPDLPLPKPKATKGRSRKPKEEPMAPAAVAPPAAPTPDLADLPAPPAPVLEELPAPPPAPAPVLEELPVGTDVGAAPDAEPMWVQPAPHPIRPSEMWHPADLAPPSLGDEVAPAPVEERYSSAELVAAELDVADPFTVAPTPAALGHDDPTYAVVPELGIEVDEADAADAPIDHLRASELESELAAAAQLTVMDDANLLPIDTPSEGGLVPGPVGRRVRRDRPALPQDQLAAVDPMGDVAADLPQISRDRGDVSPIVEPPLPPAALPTRAPETVAAAPLSSVAEVEDPVAAEPIEPAAMAVAPEAPLALTPDAAGMLAVPGTIVRLAADAGTAAELAVDGAHLALVAGWAWVSPGDGEPTAVHVELPTALATVTPGSTALTVVEEGDAAFVFVADGTVEVRRPDGVATLTRGSIAMLDPSGAAQVDHASDEELASDPIVAENLALDAEL